ncbi:MAG: metal-dependent transcriptional regulator [Candidatus Omnitrophota bacterium]
MKGRKVEEILEEIWTQREKGHAEIDGLCLSLKEGAGKEDILQVERLGYIRVNENEVSFTPKGEAQAIRVIRGHRLAERLMTDVLSISSARMESNACSFEHIIHHELAEAICTLLGHPRECPHSRPIPPGACCAKARSGLQSVVLPLSQLSIGAQARVAYITSTHYPRLGRLASLGIVPGAEVLLRQTRPSYIIQIGEVQVAMDKEILRHVYARKV